MPNKLISIVQKLAIYLHTLSLAKDIFLNSIFLIRGLLPASLKTPLKIKYIQTLQI